MATGKHTYWGYTLNNYTETELIAVRNPPEWVREHIYELEQGESGTPHVQGFCRLKVDQRMSFLTKRWLPRANLRFLSNDEYQENMRAYVQKQDATATSGVHQFRNPDPVLFPALIPEMLVKEVLDWNLPEYHANEDFFYWSDQPFPGLWYSDLSDTFHNLVDQYGFERYLRWWYYCDPELRPMDVRDFEVRELPLPWELALEVAKRQLVRKYRVETLVNRPEVGIALRSFRLQIVERIKQNASQTHVSQEDRIEEEVIVPTSESSEETRSEGCS